MTEVATATTLFAGPWQGEFGWELFCWQGYLRAISTLYREVIVASYPGHEALYRDFAHGFMAIEPSPGMPDGYVRRGIDYSRFSDLVPPRAQWVKPTTPTILKKDGCPYVADQEFIVFGEEQELDYDVLIHARHRLYPETRNRNWPKEKWLELISLMPNHWRVGWIGTKDEAQCYGHEDLRGLPLSRLIATLRKSRLVVGPSSGPMHLGCLCQVPQVVWSGNARDIPRYAEVWNPFGVRHSLLQTWQPEVSAVLSRIKGFLG